MSSGLDVFLEKLGGVQPEFPQPKKIEPVTANRLDKPQEVTYYCRVNGDKITWGYMKQIDDNLCITYNKDNNTFNIIKL